MKEYAIIAFVVVFVGAIAVSTWSIRNTIHARRIERWARLLRHARERRARRAKKRRRLMRALCQN